MLERQGGGVLAGTPKLKLVLYVRVDSIIPWNMQMILLYSGGDGYNRLVYVNNLNIFGLCLI